MITKSIRTMGITAVATLGTFAALTYSSCKKDDSTPARDKFLGTWNVSEPACGGNYTNTIVNGTTDNSILFSNLGNFNTPAAVQATVEGNTLVILNFDDGTGRVFTGNGTYSNNGFSVTYTVVYSDNTSETCIANFTK